MGNWLRLMVRLQWHNCSGRSTVVLIVANSISINRNNFPVRVNVSYLVEFTMKAETQLDDFVAFSCCCLSVSILRDFGDCKQNVQQTNKKSEQHSKKVNCSKISNLRR